MPFLHKHLIIIILIFFIYGILSPQLFKTQASEGISVYYLRYDTKISNNKIIEDNLLMIPAKNEFRVEKFSRFLISGVLFSSSGDSRLMVENQIREDALKSILIKNGLKSVNAKDYQTVISYEGVVITPLNIIKSSYNKEQNSYLYEVQGEFGTISFPENWETLGMRNRIKQIFSDFFQLFK